MPNEPDNDEPADDEFDYDLSDDYLTALAAINGTEGMFDL